MYWSLAFAATFLNYAVLMPFLPVLIRGYGYSPTMVGVLLAVCEGAAIASPFVFGHFADRLGRYRPIIAITLLLSLACGLFLRFSNNLILCAIVVPLLSFNYRAMQPLIDAVSTINLGKEGNYGKHRAIGSLTFVLILFFLQWTPFVQPNTPPNISFWVCAASLLAIIFIYIIPASYFVNKTTNSKATDSKTETSIEHDKHDSGGKLWTPMFILGFIMISLNRLAMSPIQGFLSLYLLEDLQWDAVGFMWALAAACEMPFIFLSKHFIKRFGDLPLMAFATGAIFLRLMLYAFVPIKAGVILGQCLHAFCYGLFHPAAVAFITRKVPAGQRALGMSLYLSLGSGVPTLIGNFIGGFVVDHVGYRALFIIFSSFAVMGLTLYFFTRRWTKKAQN